MLAGSMWTRVSEHQSKSNTLNVYTHVYFCLPDVFVSGRTYWMKLNCFILWLNSCCCTPARLWCSCSLFDVASSYYSAKGCFVLWRWASRWGYCSVAEAVFQFTYSTHTNPHALVLQHEQQLEGYGRLWHISGALEQTGKLNFWILNNPETEETFLVVSSVQIHIDWVSQPLKHNPVPDCLLSCSIYLAGGLKRHNEIPIRCL